MIITIDGPAASGKGTVAKALATRLGFAYLDTGAMYRAVALAGVRDAVRTATTQLRSSALLTNNSHRDAARSRPVEWRGRDGSDPRLGESRRAPARSPRFRRCATFLVPQQRRIAEGREIVCEGRDQGTVVFPDAPVKFYVTADVRVRAERRYRELVARGAATTLDREIAELVERDRRDSERADGPLRQPPEAIVIDTSRLTAEEVLNRLEGEIRKWLPART